MTDSIRTTSVSSIGTDSHHQHFYVQKAGETYLLRTLARLGPADPQANRGDRPGS